MLRYSESVPMKSERVAYASLTVNSPSLGVGKVPPLTEKVSGCITGRSPKAESVFGGMGLERVKHFLLEVP